MCRLSQRICNGTMSELYRLQLSAIGVIPITVISYKSYTDYSYQLSELYQLQLSAIRVIPITAISYQSYTDYSYQLSELYRLQLSPIRVILITAIGYQSYTDYSYQLFEKRDFRFNRTVSHCSLGHKKIPYTFYDNK